MLAPGEPSTDPYKATPDELYARGKALFDAGRLAEAAGPLEELFGGYTPPRRHRQGRRADAPDDQHQGLPARGRSSSTSRSSRRRPPSWSSPSTSCSVVGRAYRDIGEHERAYLVWRAIDRGQLPRRRPRRRGPPPARQDARRDRLPARPLARVSRHGVDRERLLRPLAGRSPASPARRSPTRPSAASWPTPGVTRSDLLLQAIRLIQVVPRRSRPRTRWPTRRAWPWSATFLELEDFEAVVKLAARFAKLYPKSTFLDSFQYSEALGEFHLGQYDRADRGRRDDRHGDLQGRQRRRPAEPEQVAGALHPRPDLRRPPPARPRRVEYYEQVADRFTDAAGAVKSLTRKDLKLPEVSRRSAPGRRSPPPTPDLRGVLGLNRADRRGRRRRTKPAVDARLPQHRRGRREGLPGRPDAALPDPPQPRRDRRDRPGRDHAAVRDDDQARRRRRTSTTRPRTIDLPLDEGRGLPGDDPGRRTSTPRGSCWSRPLELEVLEEADSRPGPRDGPRRRDEGARAQGPGQGDRHATTRRSSRARPTSAASSSPRACAAR